MRERIVLAVIAALVLSSIGPARATDKQLPKPIVRTETIYLHDKDRDGYLVGALIGAGVTYWRMHRRAKRRPPEVRVVPAECPAVQCPTCEAQTERVLQSCAAK